MTKYKEISIVMGDFNVKIGKGENTLNRTVCQLQNLISTNTFFKPTVRWLHGSHTVKPEKIETKSTIS